MKPKINIIIQKPENGDWLAFQVTADTSDLTSYINTGRGKSLELTLAWIVDMLKELDENGSLDYIKNWK